MKRCKNKTCSQPNPQPASAFNKRTGIADGLQPFCRVCQSINNSRNRKPRQPWVDNPDMYNAYRRIRYQVRVGNIIKDHCLHPNCTSPHTKCFLKSLTAKPQWFCQAHHPNRSGNRDLKIEVPDD